MATQSLSAKELARNLSKVLNEVRYQAAEYNVVCGKKIVARIIPPRKLQGLPITKLGELLANSSRLSAAEASDFLADIRLAARKLRRDKPLWGKLN